MCLQPPGGHSTPLQVCHCVFDHQRQRSHLHLPTAAPRSRPSLQAQRCPQCHGRFLSKSTLVILNGRTTNTDWEGKLRLTNMETNFSTDCTSEELFNGRTQTRIKARLSTVRFTARLGNYFCPAANACLCPCSFP